MQKQLVISITTILAVLLFISEAPARKGGTVFLKQIPDGVFKEIEFPGKTLCFKMNVKQCLSRVTCDEKRTSIPQTTTLAEFLKVDIAKVSIENNACATFTITIKRRNNPCVVSGGRVYC